MAGVRALSEAFFKPLVAGEGLFGQSFSVAPSIQVLRGLPCLGSFSVGRCIKNIFNATEMYTLKLLNIKMVNL